MARLPSIGLRSVRTKLLLTILPLVALAVGGLMLVAVDRATSEQERAAYRETAELAARNANAFEAEARESQTLARALATLGAEARGRMTREQLRSAARAFLERNPSVAGVYIGFETNAFDGRDAQYAGDQNAGPHGRVALYWSRDADGTPVFAAPLDDTAEYWTVPKQTMSDVVVDPYFFETALLTSYASPILDSGRFIGAGMVDLRLTQLHENVRRTRVLDTGYAFVVSRDGRFVSFPERSVIGVRTLQEYAKQRRDPVLAQVATAVANGRRASFRTRDPLTGEDVVMFTAPVRTGNWGFVTVAKVDEMLAEARQLRTMLLVIGAIALLVVAAVVWFIASRLTRPISAVERAAARISRGDLAVRLNVATHDEMGRMARSFDGMVGYLRELSDAADAMAKGDLSRRVEPKSDADVLGHAFDRLCGELRDALGERSCLEELVDRMEQLERSDLAQLEESLRAMSEGDLTRSAVATTEPIVASAGRSPGRLAEIFNAMLQRAGSSVTSYDAMRRQVAGMLEEISSTSEQVAAASQQMASTSEEAGRAVGEIATAIAEVAQGAERQVETVRTTRAASERADEAAKASQETTRTMAEAVERARTLADEGASAVVQAVEAMDSVRTSSQEATETIRALDAKSEQIGGIVDAIGGIAEQTNLLALNAAIEAARAGEQGRGFAVVAEEVRKLAEESREAAASIGNLIADIRSQTAHAVSVVEAGAKQTNDGVGTVEGAQETFRHIHASVQDVHARMAEIVETFAAIEAANERMREDIASVSSIAEQTSASSEQVSASTQQTTASTQEIAASARELATRAEDLERLAARFTLA